MAMKYGQGIKKKRLFGSKSNNQQCCGALVRAMAHALLSAPITCYPGALASNAMAAAAAVLLIPLMIMRVA